MDQFAVPPVDPTTLKSWLDQGLVVLIDVRERDEHAEERIPGARLAPLSTFDPTALAADKDRHIVLHCLVGGRSARALAMLAGAGFGQLHNLDGGIMAWKAAGLPTESGRR